MCAYCNRVNRGDRRSGVKMEFAPFGQISFPPAAGVLKHRLRRLNNSPKDIDPVFHFSFFIFHFYFNLFPLSILGQAPELQVPGLSLSFQLKFFTGNLRAMRLSFLSWDDQGQRILILFHTPCPGRLWPGLFDPGSDRENPGYSNRLQHPDAPPHQPPGRWPAPAHFASIWGDHSTLFPVPGIHRWLNLSKISFPEHFVG
jgi:hypothetical protein